MFWVVQAAAVASTFVLLFLFRKYTQPVAAMNRFIYYWLNKKYIHEKKL